MDFLIFYETVPREYENACLLKCELERRGYSANICSTIRVDYWKSLFYRPKVIIVPGIYDNKGIYTFVRSKRARKKCKIVDLRYEQLVVRNNDGEPMNLPKDKAQNVYHICWGDASVNDLYKFGIERQYLVKIGPIQFDLARTEFCGYFKTRDELAKEFGLDIEKKWILFTSSLAYAHLDKYQIITMTESTRLPDFENYVLYMKKVMDLLMDWIDKFLTENPDYIYIYRPHPSELETTAFQRLLNKFSNFKIIRTYSVKQWFAVADVINTWNSTSIVECYYFKKPCCVIDIPEEKNFVKFRIPIIDKSRIIRTYEEFERFNLNVTKFNNNSFPIVERERKYFYGDMDSVPVYYKLCNFLEDVLREDFYYEDYSIEPTKEMKEIKRISDKMTLYGNVQLQLFPLINKIFPQKCKVAPILEQHNPKRLRKIENNIKRQVLKVSNVVETMISYSK